MKRQGLFTSSAIVSLRLVAEAGTAVCLWPVHRVLAYLGINRSRTLDHILSV